MITYLHIFIDTIHTIKSEWREFIIWPPLFWLAKHWKRHWTSSLARQTSVTFSAQVKIYKPLNIFLTWADLLSWPSHCKFRKAQIIWKLLSDPKPEKYTKTTNDKTMHWNKTFLLQCYCIDFAQIKRYHQFCSQAYMLDNFVVEFLKFC